MSSGESKEFKYYAFISYSHQDKKWGDWLHKALETYRVPKRLVGQASRDEQTVPARIMPIFRDREELPTATDLGQIINQALEQSRYLIVICSPRSAQSKWVNEEILTYKRLGRADRILALIVDGEPNALDKADTPDDLECFPRALKFALGVDNQLSQKRTEPIAADARQGKDSKADAKLKLIAGVLGVGFDTLKQRELQRRQRRLATLTSFALILMLVMAGLMVWALLERTEAQRQGTEALRQKNDADTQRAEAQRQRDEAKAQKTIAETQRDLAASRLARFYIDRGQALARQDPTGQLLLLANAHAVQAPDRDAAIDALRIHPVLDPFELPLELRTDPDAARRLTIGRTHMISAHPSGSFQLVDLKTGARIHEAALPEKIRGVRFSHDRKQCVVYSRFHASVMNLGKPDSPVHIIKISDKIRLDPRVITLAPDLLIDYAFWSSDATVMVLRSQDRIRGFDIKTGKEIWLIEAKGSHIDALPGNRMIRFRKTQGGAYELHLLDARTGGAIGAPVAGPANLLNVLPAPDGRKVAMVHRPDKAHLQVDILDLETRAISTTPPVKAQYRGPIRFLDDRMLLVSFEIDVSKGSLTQVIDVRTGQVTTLASDKEWSVKSAVVSDDGLRLALLYFKKAIVLDIASLKPLRTIEFGDLYGQYCGFSPDNRRILVADDDLGQVFDVETGAAIGGMCRSPSTITGIGFETNDRIYLNSEIGQLLFPVRPIDSTKHETHDVGSRITHLHLDTTGRFAAMTQKKEIITVGKKPADKPLLRRVLVDMIGIGGIHRLGDTEQLHVEGVADHLVVDLESGKMLTPLLEVGKGHFHVAVHRAKRLIATIDNRSKETRSLRIWSLDDPGTTVAQWTDGGEFGSLAFGPDAGVIAIYNWPRDKTPGQLSLYTLPDARLKWKIPFPGQVGHLSFADGGRRLIVTASNPDGVTILDADHGKPIGQMIAFRPWQEKMTISGNGSGDGSKKGGKKSGGAVLVLYDIARSTPVRRARSYRTVDGKPAGPVISLDQPIRSLRSNVSGDLVWIETEKYGRIWRIENGQPTTPKLQPGPATWSVNGKMLALGDRQGDVRIIDARTGEIIWSHQGPGAITAIALDRDNRYVAFAQGSIYDSKIGKVHIMGLSGAVLDPKYLLRTSRIISGRQLDQGLALVPLSRQELADAIKRHHAGKD